MPSALPEPSISVTLLIRSLVLVAIDLFDWGKKNASERNTLTMTALKDGEMEATLKVY